MYSIRWYILLVLFHYYKYYHHLRHFFIQFYKKKNKYKIFCIGYPKTGNTSICEALNILSYRAVQWLKGALRKEPKEGWIEYIKKCNYDAFVDNPFGRRDLYKEIDKAFPDSKFILTIRDKSSFARSYVNCFKGSPWEVKNQKELKEIINFYDNRNKEVIKYFKNNSSKLLVMDIKAGDGWIKLCRFLGNSIPKKSFPHKNKGRYKNKYILEKVCNINL